MGNDLGGEVRVQEVPLTASQLVAQVESSAQTVHPLDQALIDTEAANRQLRVPMARWATRTAAIQLLCMNLFLGCIGFGWMKFDDGMFKWYMAETFGSLLGVAWVVFAYLFPTNSTTKQKPNDPSAS